MLRTCPGCNFVNDKLQWKFCGRCGTGNTHSQPESSTSSTTLDTTPAAPTPDNMQGDAMLNTTVAATNFTDPVPVPAPAPAPPPAPAPAPTAGLSSPIPTAPMPEGSAPTAETLLPAATTHVTQALRSSSGVAPEIFLPVAVDVLELFDQISQTVMPQLYRIKQSEGTSGLQEADAVPFHEIVDQYEAALSRTMATLAKVPQTIFDQKMQTLANNIGNVQQAVDAWEQCEDKQQQMAMQNHYLDALEKSVALHQLKVRPY